MVEEGDHGTAINLVAYPFSVIDVGDVVHPGVEVLVDPVNDGGLGLGTGVGTGDAINEEEDCEELFSDFVPLGKVGVLGGVDLGEDDVDLLIGEVGGGGGVFWGKLLALAP